MAKQDDEKSCLAKKKKTFSILLYYQRGIQSTATLGFCCSTPVSSSSSLCFFFRCERTRLEFNHDGQHPRQLTEMARYTFFLKYNSKKRSCRSLAHFTFIFDFLISYRIYITLLPNCYFSRSERRLEMPTLIIQLVEYLSFLHTATRYGT